MSKKKNKKVSEGDENNQVEENKEENGANNDEKGGEDGGKKDGGGGGGGGGGKNAVVLKIDLHCEGCASKVVKRIRAFEGVVNVEVDSATNKLSVTGKVDPVKLRQELEEKLHKKVEVLSPVPKKGKDDGKGKDAAGGGGGDGEDGKGEKKKDGNESNKSKKSDEKKEKEVSITTAVLKVPLHCEGCIQKINKIITKTKGYQEMKIDRQKDLVTVTGAIDMKALAESLKKHLKKDVEIVPPKKEEKKEKENEKEKEKGKGGGGGGGGNGGGGGGKGKGGGGGGGGSGGGGKGKGGGEGEDGGADEGKIDQANKMQVQFGYGYPMMPYMPVAQYGPPRPVPPGAPYFLPGPPPGYDPYQFSVHAPQIFSDENPNACSIM